MSILFTEQGASIQLGARTKLLGEYKGEDAAVRYGRLVSELGKHWTEVIREVDVKEDDPLAPDVTRATHVFIFPPQADAVLVRGSTEVAVEGTRQERMFAVINPDIVDAHAVMEFTAEPPLLRLFDLHGDMPTAALNELREISQSKA